MIELCSTANLKASFCHPISNNNNLISLKHQLAIHAKASFNFPCYINLAVLVDESQSSTAEDDSLLFFLLESASRCEELENRLANIREGRYLRAKNMLSLLSDLNMPLKWENVVKIAGNGVAPGRLHVARAMVEAGHVENLKQAFNRYMYDGGPAYSTGNELNAEEVVELICQTGGVAALAHPWALKNHVGVIRRLKAAGLHGIEVYRTFSDLADTYGLIKLGGSDYHGKGNHDESDLGSVNLPVTALHEFLKLARPIWCDAVKSILQSFAEDPSVLNPEKLARYGKIKNLKESLNSGENIVDVCLSSWLIDRFVFYGCRRTKASTMGGWLSDKIVQVVTSFGWFTNPFSSLKSKCMSKDRHL
ncbi:hypothetical protein MKW94_024584 [Papaver nudicaule]|uniref:Uncharacterized protein n=1 Tax=Papaver nudicaule TaxID=74823 RepID=A0AA41S8Z8_PAPNU|nr:hypothetical protein [Papaver nudicaule]